MEQERAQEQFQDRLHIRGAEEGLELVQEQVMGLVEDLQHQEQPGRDGNRPGPGGDGNQPGGNGNQPGGNGNQPGRDGNRPGRAVPPLLSQGGRRGARRIRGARGRPRKDGNRRGRPKKNK